MRFTSLLSKEVSKTIEPLTCEDRINCAIRKDGRSLAAHRRNPAQAKGTDVMVERIRRFPLHCLRTE